jgi:hypothetical protein
MITSTPASALLPLIFPHRFDGQCWRRDLALNRIPEAVLRTSDAARLWNDAGHSHAPWRVCNPNLGSLKLGQVSDFQALEVDHYDCIQALAPCKATTLGAS